jgi:hypothetical protein
LLCAHGESEKLNRALLAPVENLAENRDEVLRLARNCDDGVHAILDMF